MPTQVARVPSIEAPAVAASPWHDRSSPTRDKFRTRRSDVSALSSQEGSEHSRSERERRVANGAGGPSSFLSLSLSPRVVPEPRRIVVPASARSGPGLGTPARTPAQAIAARAVERDSLGGEFISISAPTSPSAVRPSSPSDVPEYTALLEPVLEGVPERALSITSASNNPRDKASRILGISHRRSMEPIPASNRTSMVSTRSAPVQPPAMGPSLPLTSLYLVSGLPKSPQTWTLSDPDSVLGLHHSEGAVNRWWRPEVLGSTVSPGAGGGKKGLKKKQSADLLKGGGVLSKQEVGKMLSKALKLSFTSEVEIIASTLQPPSTVHTFTFNVPSSSNPYGSSPSGDLLRNSVFSTTTHGPSSHGHALAPPSMGNTLFPPDPYTRPSTALLGPPSLLGHGAPPGGSTRGMPGGTSALNEAGVTYHGVCLTVWSHADAERTAAIRRTLDSARQRKESAQSLRAQRLKSLRAQAGGGPAFGRSNGNTSGSELEGPSRRKRKAGAAARNQGGWTETETDMEAETEADNLMSESEFEVASQHAPGESTVFLPGDAIFWLPYALTLVSRHPIYDLMRDYLTLSWARFSKDVQSHTLQISKILSHPAPRAGELIKLDASAMNDGPETSLEVIARFPGGMDFGRGLVDTNITMWPLFKALSADNILTICEIALAPTGRILFFSRHPAMLGIAVSTIRYLVELRGWGGIALPSVHCRDAKIFIEDPGPWIIGLATEARYSVRPPPEVCIVDLDINYLNCPIPPAAVVSVKQQRDKFRQRLLAAFEPHYHPDHCVPPEFKEAFPAGRFRPLCKIQAKRGASPAAIADIIQPPEWWNSTRIIQAFDSVLQDGMKKPSFLRRISSFGSPQRPRELTTAEQHIQLSIRKRATAFVDARDDLETKIGRLSRRLNFLMTESDLWRDKFVTFEQHAEKLSSEAHDLRSKIGKEQRETKRLSSIVNTTTAEKSKLERMLRETEDAHRQAVRDMENMRSEMEKMEEERAEMIAEVEAQIESALASMAVGVDVSDEDGQYDGASDAASAKSRGPRSRKGSIAKQPSKRHLRTFPTDTTLAEPVPAVPSLNKLDETASKVETVAEEKGEEPPESPTKKRFSAHAEDGNDGMKAVDEGISERSDRIAQKVLQIQQKLENALASDRLPAERHHKWKQPAHLANDSESEYSVDSETSAARRRRRKEKAGPGRVTPTIKGHKKDRRNRGSVGSSVSHATTVTAGDDHNEDAKSAKSASRVLPGITVTARPGKESIPEEEVTLNDETTIHVRPTPALTPKLGPSASTDESDNDFQSARSGASESPRDSYADDARYDADEHEESQWFDSPRQSTMVKPKVPLHLGRIRGNSLASNVTTAKGQNSPTFSDHTLDGRVPSPSRV